MGIIPLNEVELWFSFFAHCQIMLNICTCSKLHENIFDGFNVIKGTKSLY